ncbi:MAG: hypothetical protein QXO84_01440 [Candidatus Aenigmatarchaeota archaeon]
MVNFPQFMFIGPNEISLGELYGRKVLGITRYGYSTQTIYITKNPIVTTIAFYAFYILSRIKPELVYVI